MYLANVTPVLTVFCVCACIVSGSGGQPAPPSGPKPSSPRPGSTRYTASRGGGRPGSGFAHVPVNINISVPDTGRVVNMPKCPIILVMGQCAVSLLA